MAKIEVAVIPAAGLGTRMLPATKALPKELLPLGTRPAIEYIVEEAVGAGIREVVLITARGKEAILDHFDRHRDLEKALEAKGATEMLESVMRPSEMVKVVAVRQGLPLGLGHAVLMARELVGRRPFAVLLPDDIIDAPRPALAQIAQKQGRMGALAVMEVTPEEVSRYGIVAGDHVTDGVVRIRQMVEKPPVEKAPSRLAVIGRYILPPEIFDYLEKIPRGSGGEIQLTDAIQAMIQDGAEVHGVTFEGRRYDTGNPVGYVQAGVAYMLKGKYGTQLREALRELLD